MGRERGRRKRGEGGERYCRCRRKSGRGKTEKEGGERERERGERERDVLKILQI